MEPRDFRLFYEQRHCDRADLSHHRICERLGGIRAARFQFKGKGFVLIICLGGLMLTPQVSLVPLYSIIQSLGLYNTYWALILPYAAYRIPFTVILIRSYFCRFPKSLRKRLSGWMYKFRNIFQNILTYERADSGDIRHFDGLPYME